MLLLPILLVVCFTRLFCRKIEALVLLVVGIFIAIFGTAISIEEIAHAPRTSVSLYR